MHIIVGTAALQAFGMSPRKPFDIDLWYDDHGAYQFAEDKHKVPTEILEIIPTIETYATPDAIYTIKCSHAAWDIKWEKTISDIMYLQKRGCKLIEPLYWKLYEHWKTIHGDKSFLSLKKTSEEFFDDFVDYTFNHDFLHKVVAFPNEPVYTSVTKDGEEVLIDKEKFEALDFNSKIQMFREEVCVIALERWLIPSGFKVGILKAYKKALKKTITNLTKNWATLFIIENYYTLSKYDNKNWIDNFLTQTGDKPMSYPDVIELMKAKAEELGVEDAYELKEILVDGSEFLNDGDDAYSLFDKYIKEELGFEHIEQDGGGERGGEYCFSVIKLQGEFYKLEYSYYSHDGFDIDDIWDWKEANKVDRTVTFYE